MEVWRFVFLVLCSDLFSRTLAHICCGRFLTEKLVKSVAVSYLLPTIKTEQIKFTKFDYNWSSFCIGAASSPCWAWWSSISNLHWWAPLVSSTSDGHSPSSLELDLAIRLNSNYHRRFQSPFRVSGNLVGCSSLVLLRKASFAGASTVIMRLVGGSRLCLG